MIKHFLLILIFLFGCFILQGQKTGNMAKNDQACHTILTEADRMFQEGHYDKCIIDLEGVLKSCDLSRSEKEHSLELLAKAYLETDDPGKAESTVFLLLTDFPHYELKEADNSELFNRLIKKYKVHPMLSIGVRNTADWIMYKTTKVFSVLDGLDYSAPYEHKGYGFMYYGWGELEFDKDISLNGELIFMWTTYGRSIHKDPAFNLNFGEKDNYMEIPLYLKKYFHINENVLTYVSAGMNWLLMTKAIGNASLSYTKNDIITGKNVDYSASTGNVNMLEMRNKNTYEWLAGAGIGYKLKNLRLFLDVRYFGGINSFTNANKRLSNSSLINDYYYVDNSVKLNQFEIGASISYTFINSVKRVRH